MSEPNPTTEPVVKEPVVNQDTPKPDVNAIDKGDDKGMIPKSRFDEVNDRMKTAELALKKTRDDQEALRVKTLEEQGKHKEIAEEATQKLAIAQEENEKFKAEREIRVAALIAKLPEPNQEFAVKHGLDLIALQDYSEQVLTGGTVNHIDPRNDSPGGYKAPDKPWGEWTKQEKLDHWAEREKIRTASK